MSKPVNKTMIGAFVIIAVALALAAIVVLGSGKFFAKRFVHVSFFEGSVKGLNVGSPVMFRGVKVGEVTDIIVNFNPDLTFLIPVIYQIEPKKFKLIGDGLDLTERDLNRELIKKGLKAQLQIQSLVTGQLMINLDFAPDRPIKLIGVEKVALSKEITEVPTIPTPFQELEKAFSELNIPEIATDIKRAMNGIARFVDSSDLRESIGVLKQTLSNIQNLTSHMDSKIEPLTTGIDQTLVEVRAAVGEARNAIDDTRSAIGDARKLINKQGPLLASNIKSTVEEAKMALEQADTTLKSIEDIAQQGGLLRQEISAALKEISAAARSVRVLADFIEQHPDAVIRGRATQTGGN